MKRGFVIHHNGPWTRLSAASPHTACISFWNGIKAYHTNPEPEGKGWSGVAYSFMVCHHGHRLDGQGWNKNQFANGKDVVGEYDGNDSEWYTVFVPIGWNESNGAEQATTPAMERGVADLINEGRRTGRCGNRVLPHNRFKIKRCPGKRFTDLANQWDNRPISLATVLEEDEMNAAQMKELKAHIDGRLLRMMSFMLTGKGNAWVSTNMPEFAWADDPSTITLNEVYREVTGDEVDEAAIVSGILAGVSAQTIASVIPSEFADEVIQELLEADLTLRITEDREVIHEGDNS
jgi:hypothetical protein